ncbi:MAG: nuclear transport factor 2 family protein [Gemmatimonadota bacterium]|jgi:uncharacterized protein (TIGR02246 family)
MYLAVSWGCGFERQESAEGRDSAAASSSTAAEIEAMLQASAASWNRGDLEGFLDDYWRSEKLTFSGEDGVTRGWEDVRTRYLDGYWAPGATRDSLRFEAIEVMGLSPDHALALGQYVLFRPEEESRTTSTGYFSLVLQRLGGRWRILHDHTSAAPDPEGPQGEGS